MKVGIYIGNTDPQIGGGSTLLRTIQDELKDLKECNYEFCFIFSGGRKGARIKEVDGQKFYNIDRVINNVQKLKQKIFDIVNYKNSYKYYRWDVFAREYGIDIFWLTSPGKVDISYPYIYTVWDLGHRTVPYFPEVSQKGQWEIRESNYSVMIPKATFVITGNEIGKKEILDNYKVSPNKIKVAQFPVSSFCYGEEIKPEFDIPDQYFFYPAQFWAHKNHICIVEAVKLMKYRDGFNPKVFFTGSDKGNKTYILSKIKEYGLEENIIITGFLKEEELKYLYTHATAMIFASLMGPNNLPPIEATYLNCPVIITDLDGHIEQLGDSAMYFNGYKADELVEKMRILLTDNNIRDSLKERQAERKDYLKGIKYSTPIMELLDEFQKIRSRWA